jgi:hypothetical protein
VVSSGFTTAMTHIDMSCGSIEKRLGPSITYVKGFIPTSRLTVPLLFGLFFDPCFVRTEFKETVSTPPSAPTFCSSGMVHEPMSCTDRSFLVVTFKTRSASDICMAEKEFTNFVRGGSGGAGETKKKGEKKQGTGRHRHKVGRQRLDATRLSVLV